MPQQPDLSVDLGAVALSNPVMPGSGCFGLELGDLIDLNRLGALVTKTIFLGARSGNPANRLAETENGLLNSVGIPSRGITDFIENTLPRYQTFRVPLIVSVGGLTVEEYWRVAERLGPVSGVAALEVNVSCPNLEAGGLEIGASPANVESVVRGVVDRSRVPVFAKLTPNVTSIADIARAAEAGGAEGVTAINTVLGMQMDTDSGKQSLGNVVGGLSGPAIKPIALRMVWDVVRAVQIPVIASGGIATARDAIEFLRVGASAVQVGTANFTRPDAMIRMIDDLTRFLVDSGRTSVREVIGTFEVERSAVGSVVVASKQALTGTTP